MKIKIIFSLFLILLIKNNYAQAGWGSPFADSLMHLHNVANGGYKGYINIPVKDTVDSEKFQLAQILGADRAEYNKILSMAWWLHCIIIMQTLILKNFLNRPLIFLHG